MDGVYVEVNKLTLLNVPEGADQVAEVALPPMIPAKFIIEPEQMGISVPALAVALALTVKGTEKVCAGQNPPELVKLKVKLKFPLLGKVTVYGPDPEPLTIAPIGHVQL